jgi:hypothetical protein
MAHSSVVIHGGQPGTQLFSLEDAKITLFGTEFSLPLGPVAALNGQLSGTLADGTPFFCSFGRASSAQIVLASATDADGDGLPEGLDNCPLASNPDQADTDGDGVGDACNDGEDSDGDEWSDVLDNCEAAANADQANRDGDPVGDTCDHCPDHATAENTDFDGNGVGDDCECGDQTNDATVNVLDLLGINLAIFGSVEASPLCDTNFDGLCNVQDIVGANQKIFGQPAYCERYPPPAP